MSKFPPCFLHVPSEIKYTIKNNFFSSLWNNIKDKIQRESIYQGHDKGGICMTDVNTMMKGFRLAWIPRLLKPESSN